jgi:ElaB/YqjD/DUF883 family membrane-anchored ribosome-binding protein
MAVVDDLSSEVNQLRKEISSIKGELGSLLASLKEKGAEQSQAVYQRAREAGEVVRDQAVHAQEQVGGYIEARPIASVALAFGTGFALGTLVASRVYH